MMRLRKIEMDRKKAGKITGVSDMSDEDLMNIIYRTEDMVEKSPLLQTVDDRCRDQLVMSLIPISYPGGSMVVRKGDHGEEMYFIARGLVEVLASNGDRLSTFGDGEYFGEISLLSAGKRLHSVRTMESTDMYALHRDAFLKLIDEFPEDVEVFVMTALKRTLGALQHDYVVAKKHQHMGNNEDTEKSRKKVKALIKVIQGAGTDKLPYSEIEALIEKEEGTGAKLNHKRQAQDLNSLNAPLETIDSIVSHVIEDIVIKEEETKEDKGRDNRPKMAFLEEQDEVRDLDVHHDLDDDLERHSILSSNLRVQSKIMAPDLLRRHSVDLMSDNPTANLPISELTNSSIEQINDEDPNPVPESGRKYWGGKMSHFEQSLTIAEVGPEH